METTTVGYKGVVYLILEKKMETTIINNGLCMEKGKRKYFAVPHGDLSQGQACVGHRTFLRGLAPFLALPRFPINMR